MTFLWLNDNIMIAGFFEDPPVVTKNSQKSANGK